MCCVTLLLFGYRYRSHGSFHPEETRLVWGFLCVLTYLGVAVGGDSAAPAPESPILSVTWEGSHAKILGQRERGCDRTALQTYQVSLPDSLADPSILAETPTTSFVKMARSLCLVVCCRDPRQ